MTLSYTLKVFFRYILKAKWTIKPSRKNKFILVDGNYNPFLKYIKKDMTVLCRRGEEINLYILLKCYLKLKFQLLIIVMNL